jgi:PKD repeat protein
MRVRRLLLAILSTTVLTSCDEDTAPAPSSPSSPSTPSTSATPSPATTANRPPGPITLNHQPQGLVLAGATSVNFGAQVTDPDGDALTYTWDFRLEELTTTVGGIGYTFRRPGEYRVRLTVTDGKGGSSTAETTVTVGTLEGTWRVENAAHETMEAVISHSGTASISGRLTNGVTFSGSVGDPFRVTVQLDARNSYCLQSGVYAGSTDVGLNHINFPGAGCRGFQLFRR